MYISNLEKQNMWHVLFKRYIIVDVTLGDIKNPNVWSGKCFEAWEMDSRLTATKGAMSAAACTCSKVASKHKEHLQTETLCQFLGAVLRLTEEILHHLRS